MRYPINFPKQALTRLRLRPTRCISFSQMVGDVGDRRGRLGDLGGLGVRSIRHAVGDARDAVFDQRDVEINEEAQALVRQPEVRQ